MYNNPEKHEFKTFGFVPLYQDTILDQIYPETSTIYRQTLARCFRHHGMDTIVCIDERIDYQHPDTNQIKYLCEKYRVDGIIVGRLYFYQIDLKAAIVITLSREWYAEVFLNTYAKNGKLAIRTGYNTKIKGSKVIPKEVDAVRDGTYGAVEQICKALGKEAL